MSPPYSIIMTLKGGEGLATQSRWRINRKSERLSFAGRAIENNESHNERQFLICTRIVYIKRMQTHGYEKMRISGESLQIYHLYVTFMDISIIFIVRFIFYSMFKRLRLAFPPVSHWTVLSFRETFWRNTYHLNGRSWWGSQEPKPQWGRRRRVWSWRQWNNFFSTSHSRFSPSLLRSLLFSDSWSLVVHPSASNTFFTAIALETYNLSHPVPTVEINVNKLRRERENYVLPELFSGLCRRDNLSSERRTRTGQLADGVMQRVGHDLISLLDPPLCSESSRPFHRPNIHTASLRLREKENELFNQTVNFD